MRSRRPLRQVNNGNADRGPNDGQPAYVGADYEGGDDDDSNNGGSEAYTG